MITTPRRRVLAAAATGTALSVAGCSTLDDGDAGDDADALDEDPDSGEANATDDADGDASSGETAAATVAVDIEDRDGGGLGRDIEQRYENDTIDEEEARTELQEAQLAVLEETIADVEAYAADVDGLAVTDTAVRSGLVLVDGDATAIIDTLDSDDAAALLAADQFPST